MSAQPSAIPAQILDLFEYLWSRQPATDRKPADTADLKLVCGGLIQRLADPAAVRRDAAAIREQNIRGGA